MSKKQELTDKIWVWEDIVKPNLLNNIISKDWWSYNNCGGGETLIGRGTIINKSMPEYLDILNVFETCLKEYNGEISLSCIDTNRFLVREYGAGSYMTEHADGYSYVVDGDKEVMPVFTIIYYLNDDYNGGEIVFPNVGISIKPKAGSVVIFPSSEMHKVEMVNYGVRYMTQTYIHDGDVSKYKEKK